MVEVPIRLSRIVGHLHGVLCTGVDAELGLRGPALRVLEALHPLPRLGEAAPRGGATAAQLAARVLHEAVHGLRFRCEVVLSSNAVPHGDIRHALLGPLYYTTFAKPVVEGGAAWCHAMDLALEFAGEAVCKQSPGTEAEREYVLLRIGNIVVLLEDVAL
eukprot:CAMPEP_0179366846 /NCGR_PEP_ID=MMETSP0797-20121207/83270_1 /TAXON_ID=47934 /ORGANISM="Dinophysis acuminata, Strain DAEP01" /LENGTH=159 /DNA_ID=CAMNT_0021082379 /DNA_START=358 /DNA_END=837 /DNA_ORIENTATION=-